MESAFQLPPEHELPPGHGLFMVEDIPDLHVSFVNETYMVKLKPGLIMADTGCKKAVGRIRVASGITS